MPVPVLRGVDLSVRSGELLAVVGPSGSGKSTLLQCLSGLDEPTSGRVTIAGTDLATLNPGRSARFRREHMGFVFQSYNLVPALTAFENVALPFRLRYGRVDTTRVQHALESVGLLDVAHLRPGRLSGGQQQRVAIARTIATRPSIVFADEPTGALDVRAGDRVLALLRDAAAGERSVVMVTHDPRAAALADRVIVLEDGAVRTELQRADAAAVFAAMTGDGQGR